MLFRSAHVRAGDVMSRPVVGCAPDDSIDAVLATMARHGVRRLPVLETGREQLHGILTLNDIVAGQPGTGAPSTDAIVAALRGIHRPRAGRRAPTIEA